MLEEVTNHPVCYINTQYTQDMSFATPQQSKRVTFATTECTSVFIPSADLSEEIPIPTKDSICTRTID